MRWLAILTAVVGCGPTSTPTPRVPSAPDDAAVGAAVERFFEAVDRRDATLLGEVVTEGFVLFEDGRSSPANVLTRLWKDSRRPPRTRTCERESLRRSRTAIVYIGECSESQPGFGDRAAETFNGWNTVVLVPDAGRWKVALWQWQRGGIEGDRARWNDAYRRGTWFTKKPNMLLVATAGTVEPGAALVLTMGQGRNALHLAAKGWKVTGVDLSEIGVAQARDAARERGLELDAVVADINTYDFGESKWDMVTMLYAGSDRDWTDRAMRALRPGGLFVFEHFLVLGEDGGPEAKAELVGRFTGWEILRDEIVVDTADWGKRKTRLVRLVARKPR